jgi:hypothetical protein
VSEACFLEGGVHSHTDLDVNTRNCFEGRGEVVGRWLVCCFLRMSEVCFLKGGVIMAVLTNDDNVRNCFGGGGGVCVLSG